MFERLGNKQRKKEIKRCKKEAEQNKWRAFYASGIRQTTCSSVWMNLFLLTGNVFAFAQFITTANAELNKQGHNPHIYTNSAVDSFAIAQPKRLSDQIVHSKIMLDPRADNLTLQQCQDVITQRIQNATISSDLAQEYIPAVIEQRNFRIVCTNRERLNKDISGNQAGEALGFFISMKNQMHLTLTTPVYNYLHEFWHARQKQLHSTRQCKQTDFNFSSTLPYFPDTPEEQKKLTSIINAIFDEANECRLLLDLEDRKVKLTYQQKTKLANYKAAAEHALPIYTSLTLGEKMLKQLGSKLNMPEQLPLFLINDKYPAKVVGFDSYAGSISMQLMYTDKCRGWVEHIFWIENKMQKEVDKKMLVDKQVLLEMDAYIMQFATRKLLLGFGGQQLLEHHEEHAKKCSPNFNSPHSKRK